MPFDRFEVLVLQLASRGVSLTLPNVAAHLELPLEQVEAHLDQMARLGRLEMEVDDRLGVVRYHVPGLDRVPPLPSFGAAPATTAPAKKKNVVLGALLALLIPGFGLLYAAPASIGIVAGLLALVAAETLGALPVLGAYFEPITQVLLAMGSGALGVLYVRQYNRFGSRTHLDSLRPRALRPSRAAPV